MRHVWLFLAVGLLIAADGPKGGEDKRAKEIEGTWQGVAAKDSSIEGMLKSVWEFKDGKLTFTHFQDNKFEWKYRHDPKKSPKEIDLISGKGKTMKGIYKIEKDTLTICHIKGTSQDPEKRARPTDFDPTKRDDVIILTFERKKP